VHRSVSTAAGKPNFGHYPPVVPISLHTIHEYISASGIATSSIAFASVGPMASTPHWKILRQIAISPYPEQIYIWER